ncbi:hypothetical protein GRF29_44g1344902 [Pseudopithomyces chartarum]|uniref:Ubiquitin-conjugating enzyme E2 2 n=1 Tax=Pseudopithomyces chartarum TaxID=1892770 RepID=A0AAN6LZF4_9PLEO|nr:hypothetical protein GRF29_44g1344902 [Pseudopithomyces chartarum]
MKRPTEGPQYSHSTYSHSTIHTPAPKARLSRRTRRHVVLLRRRRPPFPPAQADAKRQEHIRHLLRAGRLQRLRVGSHAHDRRRNKVLRWRLLPRPSDLPPEYPLLPPKMRFETPLFHPNIYPNGDVCISILHPPEEDKYGYESAAERWSPVQTPETILLSVISMLSSPNDESPANVEAAGLWRDNLTEFKKRVRKCVRDSLEFE